MHASWGTGPGKLEQWTLLARARAIDTTGFVAAVGQAYPGDEIAALGPTGVGGSVVASPVGEVVTSAGADPQLLVADIDLETARQGARDHRGNEQPHGSTVAVRQNRGGDRPLGQPEPATGRRSTRRAGSRSTHRANGSTHRAQPQYPQGPPRATPRRLPQRSRRHGKKRRRDGISIVLILVIVLALVVAGAIGVELYARHRGETKVAKVVECLAEDKADVSFGMMPPFLIQHMTKKYSSIHIETDGNQLSEAKGMKLDLTLDDVNLEDTADSKGTIGGLDAIVTWTSAGMQQPSRTPFRSSARWSPG